MFRDIVSNKWIIGGVVFLIVFGVGCYFWYQHELAPYKQEAAKTADLLKQSENVQKNINSAMQDKASQEVPFIENGVVSTNEERQETSGNVVNNSEQSTLSQTKTAKVRLSPNGFGPLPTVPPDYPDKKFRWRYYTDDPNFELIARVKLKVWEEQRKYAAGASFMNGKVYLIFPDTAYVRWERKYGHDGEVIDTYINEILWHPDYEPSDEQWQSPLFDMSRYLKDVIKGNNLKVIDFDNGGIEPYTFLNL